MLQNDIGEENDNDGFIIPDPNHTRAGSSPTSPLSQRPEPRRITNIPTPDLEHGGDQVYLLPTLLSQYWNHFPQSTTRALRYVHNMSVHLALVILGPDPALVFGEILGVIKGSEKTIGTQQRCLDRDTYLSSGRQGMFSHTKEAVYDLFTSIHQAKATIPGV
jgi:hypothetical protein